MKTCKCGGRYCTACEARARQIRRELAKTQQQPRFIKIATTTEDGYVVLNTSDNGVERIHIGESKFNPVIPVAFNVSDHAIAIRNPVPA